MLRNYLKIAVRNLLKNKVYSLINILGLAIGLATSLLISLYVLHQFSYDDFNEHADRIFRVVQTMESEIRTEEQASTPFRLGPVLKAENQHLVSSYVRFYNLQEADHSFLNRKQQISFREEHFYFVDSTFFDVFSNQLIRGNPDEVLRNPLSLVITEEIARKYFGEQDPIGQSISFKGILEFTVTGIMAEWPEKSHMNVELLGSFSSVNELYEGSPGYDRSWLWNPVWTYILLNEGSGSEDLKAQFPGIVNNYYRAYSGWPPDESLSLDLQPITSIHLNSALDQEMQPNSSKVYMYILIIVAFFVLVIACINFMNLSTARSMERSKEVGMRKVLGGIKQQLFYQFIGESIIMTGMAIIFGVLLVKLTLPYFNILTDTDLSFNLFHDFYTLPALILLTLLVGFFAGIYPAVFLSSFKPINVLKGNNTTQIRGTLFRKTLVTFQFILSIILIIGTSVIYLQLNYIQNKDLGFNENEVLILPTKQNLIAWEFDTFRKRVLDIAQVQNIAGIGKIPGSNTQDYYNYVSARNEQGSEGLNLAFYVTHDAIETFELEIIAGRSFSREFLTDADNAILINRRMLTQLNIADPQDALGETFYYYPPQGERQTFSVVGVTENFNYTSLKKEIEPLVIRLVEGTRPVLRSVEHTAIKIAPGSSANVLPQLEKIWKEMNPIDPFEYRFLTDHLSEIYRPERTMNSISNAFSILCILIACLGLLGLASYSAQLRRKEIGIRKSLGASFTDIILLLSKDFLMLILIANFIAWPVSYLLSSNWLSNFPYRIDLLTNLPLIFGATALLILTIAGLTVGYYSVKAAFISPVKAIRNN